MILLRELVLLKMSRNKTKDRLRERLLKKENKTAEEKEEEVAAKRLAEVRDNIRARLDKAVKRRRFDALEYTYFSKHHFIHYLYLMADGCNGFDKIDQETVDSLDMVLRENNTYEEFAASHSQDWVETDGVMCAFKYLFKCRR